VDASGVAQVLDGVAEQFDELARGGVAGAPPEPAAVVLVEGTEDDRDRRAVRPTRALDRLRYAVEEGVEVRVLRTTGKNAADDSAGGVVEVLAGDEVRHVGAEGVDSAARVPLPDAPAERGDVLGFGSVLDAGAFVAVEDEGVPAEDRGVVPHRRSGVGRLAVGSGEGEAVGEVVLMAEKDASALLPLQVREQRASGGGRPVVDDPDRHRRAGGRRGGGRGGL
jgi:hypothetical protein